MQQNPERLSEPLCLGEMAGIKEMRDELLGLLYEQLGFLDRSHHLTMPAYTSPGFPETYLVYLGFSAPLRWRVAERVDAAWLAMQPRIRRANAPRVLVGCGFCHPSM